MARKLILILSCLYCTLSYGQAFKHNPDYIWAVGSGNTLDEADRNALVELGRTIEAEVHSSVSIKRHVVTDGRGRTISQREEYSSNSTIDSRVLVKRAKMRVQHRAGSFTVYRYINRKEYLTEHAKAYGKLLDYIETLPQRPEGRQINLLLGAYYRAFSIIDDPLLEILDESYTYKKEALKAKARKVYGTTCTLHEFDRQNLGWISVNSKERRCIYAFEYSGDGGQKWRTPISFRADKSDSSGDGRMDGDYDIVSKYTLCWVQRDFREPKTRKDMIYRILYEAQEEGRTVRIDVPDDWYFTYGNLFMFW